jgi:hypothetical protein
MATAKLCECGCGEPAPIAAKTSARLGHIQGQPVRFVCGHATRGRRLTGDHRAKISASLRGLRSDDRIAVASHQSVPDKPVAVIPACPPLKEKPVRGELALVLPLNQLSKRPQLGQLVEGRHQ